MNRLHDVLAADFHDAWRRAFTDLTQAARYYGLAALRGEEVPCCPLMVKAVQLHDLEYDWNVIGIDLRGIALPVKDGRLRRAAISYVRSARQTNDGPRYLTKFLEEAVHYSS